jgi:hypothetical protein
MRRIPRAKTLLTLSLLSCGISNCGEPRARSNERRTSATSNTASTGVPIQCLQPQPTDSEFAYGYAPESGRCLPVDESSSKIGGRFKTLHDCIESCNAKGPDVCNGLPPAGCERMDLAWWYNREENRCEPHADGNCRRFGNSFASARDCRAACGGYAIASAEECPGSKPTGTCSGTARVCLYDVVTLCRCDKFERQCVRDSKCTPNAVAQRRAEQCRQQRTGGACEGGPYFNGVPWSCTCRAGQWHCSRLGGGEEGYYTIQDGYTPAVAE